MGKVIASTVVFLLLSGCVSERRAAIYPYLSASGYYGPGYYGPGYYNPGYGLPFYGSTGCSWAAAYTITDLTACTAAAWTVFTAAAGILEPTAA
jgi:hypothetical protein